ncbi:Ubiquitin domain-containing protein DSK2b [Bienertia sinuspersici]
MGAEGDSSETTVVAAEEVSVNIRCSNGSKFSVKTTLDSNVGAFKALVAQNCDVPADQQRLIYKGRILKDDQTLESYGLQADHTIHMVRGFAASASTAPSGTTAASDTAPAAAPTSAAPTATPTESGGLGGAGLGASLFPGLGGLGGTNASGLLGAGLPDFEQMQQQLTQNPNMMREIMNMPAIQSLMNNPDLMRNLIMSNPQMRDIIDRNPELAHILNDPSILRQTLETARNPELMREMMRNTDRAMSNIESSPEGFNMLRRMYENVQEPFLNATTMAGEGGNNQGSNPFASLLGTQGAVGDNREMALKILQQLVLKPEFLILTHFRTPGTVLVLISSGGTQTNSTPRTNPSGDTRPSPVGGLSSLPELDRMFGGGGAGAGGVPDASMMNQVMQNPAISQMMQSMLSNPQYMNQILNMSPQLRTMTESNPQLREMMQNPDVLRQLASPEMMQTNSEGIANANHAAVTSICNEPSQSNQDQSANAGAAPAGNANNMGLEMLMNMFGGLGAGGLTTPENPNVPPEELYATQLTQLQEMGFFDAQENIRALQATRGNVNAAVERLLGNMGQ